MIYIKRTAAAILAFIIMLLLPICRLIVFAEGGAAIFVSSKAAVGDTVDVILTFTSDSEIGWVETNFIYDDTMLSYLEGDYTGGNGVLHIRDFPDAGNNTFSILLKFSALSVGNTQLSLANCVISSTDGAPMAEPSASASIEITSDESSTGSETSETGDSSVPDTSSEGQSSEPVPPEKTGVLQGLSFSDGVLYPEFSPDIYQYTLKIPDDIDRVEVSARKYDEDYIWFKCSTWFDESEEVTRHVFHIVEDETKLIITLSDEDKNPKSTYTDFVERASELIESQADFPAAVTTLTSLQSEDLTSPTETSRTGSEMSSSSGMEDLKRTLMPALLIILAVLVIALIILIKWIGGRSDRRRKKITTTSKK